MSEAARRYRLGLFTLGVGALFVALLAFILHNSLGKERTTYFILFRQNVKGMVVGSRVNFQGVPIGVVADMRFQDGKTLVELRVDPTRANVQDITCARMDRLLVTGQVTVELEGYGPGGRSLPPGAFIQPKEDPLQALTASLPDVVAQASGVMARLERVLAGAERLLSEENQAHVTAVLANAERATRQIDERTLPAVQSLLHETTALAAGVRGPAQSALAGMRATLDDLRRLVRQLKLAPDSLLFGVQEAAPAGGGE